MNTTTRRKVIAGAAALPLLPAAATLPAFATPADPAVVAYRTWREYLTTLIRVLEPDSKVHAT